MRKGDHLECERVQIYKKKSQRESERQNTLYATKVQNALCTIKIDVQRRLCPDLGLQEHLCTSATRRDGLFEEKSLGRGRDSDGDDRLNRIIDTSGKEGRPLGTKSARESVILLVATTHDHTILQQDGSTDMEVGVRSIRGISSFFGLVDKSSDVLRQFFVVKELVVNDSLQFLHKKQY